MKKIKRIDLKNFGGIRASNHQRAQLVVGLNNIMDYLEYLNKKIDKIEISKEDK